MEQRICAYLKQLRLHIIVQHCHQCSVVCLCRARVEMSKI